MKRLKENNVLSKSFRMVPDQLETKIKEWSQTQEIQLGPQRNEWKKGDYQS